MLYNKLLNGNLWVVEMWGFIFAFQDLITFYSECILLQKNKRLFLMGEWVGSGRGFLEHLLPTLIFFKGGKFLTHHIDLKKHKTQNTRTPLFIVEIFKQTQVQTEHSCSLTMINSWPFLFYLFWHVLSPFPFNLKQIPDLKWFIPLTFQDYLSKDSKNI